MQQTQSFAPHPVFRVFALMSEMARDLLPPQTPRPAGAHRSAGPAAELLRKLPARTTLSVEEPLGLDVVCLMGTLWLTHDGDTIDHVLEAGCTYTAKRGGRLLIHALTDARFVVQSGAD